MTADTIGPMKVQGSASPLGHALVLMGDSWSVKILQSIFIGERRFQVIRDVLKISDPVLSSRLRRLIDDGILEKRAYQERPTRHEYLLTEAGKDLWRVLISLWAWDRTWAPRNHPLASVDLKHLTCGNLTRPIFGCGHCGGIGLTARDVRGAAEEDLLIDVTQRRSRRSPAPSGGIDSTSVLGDRWSIMVLSVALMGSHHFGEFEARLGVSPVTLNDRLASFVESGMMTRESVTEGAKRQVYRLTPMGLDFFTVTTMINSWARTWLSERGQSGLSLTHIACGHEIEPRFTCNRCYEPLERTSVKFVDFDRAALRT